MKYRCSHALVQHRENLKFFALKYFEIVCKIKALSLKVYLLLQTYSEKLELPKQDRFSEVLGYVLFRISERSTDDTFQRYF